MKQTNLFDEIIIDNFAGGGGASTGIEMAAGRPVAVAINHDPDAILLHKTNHPYTEHLQASVWDVDPVKVCKGRPVGLAWFSPDCKHFSKAKGAALVDRNIRGLAWIVLRWAARVRPRVIMLENVEEFVTWGPVRKGKPIKSKAGQTFQKWKQQLSDLGYEIEHRELVAADYGAPTIRKRFVLVARCDGKPIVWPEKTHAPKNSDAVTSGKLLPWRSAAEIIDWSIPGYSIFDSKQEIKEKYGVNVVRPLADNTLRRVIRGVDKFTIRSGNPFIVECNHGGDGHTRDITTPINTVTRKYTGGLCQPIIAPVTFPNTDHSVGSPANLPIHTITSAGNQVLASANLMCIGQTGGGDRIRDVRSPIATVVSKQESCLTCANLVEYYGNGYALSPEDPMHTATSHDREAIVSAHIQKFYGGVVGTDPQDNPMPTITTVDHNALCAAHVVEFKGTDIGQAPERPLRTITASAGEFAACQVTLQIAENKQLGHWPEIRALLNKHCGYSLQDNEILLLVINGQFYYLSDITLRMIIPRELYSAMGFPIDYIIDRDYLGNKYPKNKQVARCGNAVCPPLAEAMVRANFPEWCRVKRSTMAQLFDEIAI